MPTRIGQLWTRRSGQGARALIPFITAGFPNKSATRVAIASAARAGADMVEIGVPFSDPLADGPAIQRSSQDALRRGVNLPWILETVARVRRDTDLPLVLMGYYNPVLQYGLKAFCRDAVDAGVDGLIVPDLPPDEAAGLRASARKSGLSLVFLSAPTTTQERVKAVARASTDFCYCVTVTGVTGARRSFDARTDAYLRRVRRWVGKPTVAGFGVARAEHVRRLGKWTDGVVVGSALVPVLQGAPAPRRGRALEQFLKPLVRAAHEM
jgi:tryptophan synthase alpha chain